MNLIILPHAAQAQRRGLREGVERPDGAPLVHFSKLQREALEKKSGKRVLLAMGYGKPSLAEAAAQLDGVDAPHGASPCFRTTRRQRSARCWRACTAEDGGQARGGAGGCGWCLRSSATTAFLDALAAVIRRSVGNAEHLLLSYHGLPERQVRAADAGCLRSDDCCARVPKGCYRAQCLFDLSRNGRAAGAADRAVSVAPGPRQWLAPSTETHVEALAKRGIRRLAVACLSFAADRSRRRSRRSAFGSRSGSSPRAARRSHWCRA